MPFMELLNKNNAFTQDKAVSQASQWFKTLMVSNSEKLFRYDDCSKTISIKAVAFGSGLNAL